MYKKRQHLPLSLEIKENIAPAFVLLSDINDIKGSNSEKNHACMCAAWWQTTHLSWCVSIFSGALC